MNIKKLMLTFAAVICLQNVSVAATIIYLHSASSCFKSKTTDTIGSLISTIDFKLKANKDERESFDDGIVPWINIEKPNQRIDSLIDADEVVLSFDKATIIIDYPLKKQVSFDVTSTTGGFSRKQLIMLISQKYHDIYTEEERTLNTKVVPADQRKELLNRNETDGKYGIWGHDLSDLDLSSIDVYKNSEGKIYLMLNVES